MVLTGRDRGLLYSLDPENKPANTYYALDSSHGLVKLEQRGEVPDTETVQMAFGPAGLLVTQDGSQMWPGSLS